MKHSEAYLAEADESKGSLSPPRVRGEVHGPVLVCTVIYGPMPVR